MEGRAEKSLFLRNFIFGVEDSLVSTVGFLSGIATNYVPQTTLVLTGFIYIFVEAFSMAVGSFLSEDSAQEYIALGEVSDKLPILGGVVMFFSSVLAGLVPIAPYLVFSGTKALYFSIAFSLVSLFILGFINGRLSAVKPLRRAARMAVFGGMAILIGVLVGRLFNLS